MNKAKLLKKEKGFTLLEVVLSLALLGIVAAGFLGALATGSRAISIADERATAESLARTQLEFVRSQPYDADNNPPEYLIISDIPDGYYIILNAVRLDYKGDGDDPDDGIQNITVIVVHNEEEVFTLEGYRTLR
jgi:prepilin-type N-terminal cleavage/methylation domain-containing protein